MFKQYYKKIEKINSVNILEDFQVIVKELSLFVNYSNLLKKLEYTIGIYLEKNINVELNKITNESIKNFIYILPYISKYKDVLVNIELESGFINCYFNTKDNGLLSILITDKGNIHFSRVSEDINIYKISGMLKVKNKMDLKHLEKVLRML
jgi:hypothetical protein